jgi:hypothetical protein
MLTLSFLPPQAATIRLRQVIIFAPDITLWFYSAQDAALFYSLFPEAPQRSGDVGDRIEPYTTVPAEALRGCSLVSRSPRRSIVLPFPL